MLGGTESSMRHKKILTAPEAFNEIKRKSKSSCLKRQASLSIYATSSTAR
jgi:hypothetical protein